MSLQETLRKDLSDAIHKKDADKISTLRLLTAAIQNKEIEERKKDVGLGDDGIVAVIQKEAKKRRDASGEYKKAGRQDLASQEQKELAILEAYLPKELSDEEILRIVKDGIRELDQADENSFGQLMKIVMPILKGRASGDRISMIAKKILMQSSK